MTRTAIRTTYLICFFVAMVLAVPSSSHPILFDEHHSSRFLAQHHRAGLDSSYLYNLSYTQIHGSPYPIQFNYSIPFSDHFTIPLGYNSDLYYGYEATDSIIKFGYINRDSKLDMIISMVNTTFKGCNRAFVIYVYYNIFFREPGYTVTESNYDMVILGPKNVTLPYIVIYRQFPDSSTCEHYGPDYFFATNLLKLDDINNDGYDDIVVLHFTNSTTSSRTYLDPLSNNFFQTSYPLYRDGVISILYGGQTGAEKTIYIDRNEHGSHPNIQIENLPSSFYGCKINIADTEGDHIPELIYFWYWMNYTHIGNDTYYVSNMTVYADVINITMSDGIYAYDSIHYGRIFLNVINTAVHDNLELPFFICYPPLITIANLNSLKKDDILITTFSPPFDLSSVKVYGIYDYTIDRGRINLTRGYNFCITTFYAIVTSTIRFNDDLYDDLLFAHEIFITDPAELYSGNLSHTDYDNTVSLPDEDNRDWIAYFHYKKKDYDLDGYEDLPLVILQYGTAIPLYFCILKTMTTNITTPASIDNGRAFYVNLGNKDISEYFSIYANYVLLPEKDVNRHIFTALKSDFFSVRDNSTDPFADHTYLFYRNFTLNIFDLPPVVNSPPDIVREDNEIKVFRGDNCELPLTVTDDYDIAANMTVILEYALNRSGEWKKADGPFIIVNNTAGVYRFSTRYS